MDIEITTFGYGHAPAPDAHLTVDLRRHFRDPHVDPALRHLTARDAPVRHAVLNTPGIKPLILSLAEAIAAYMTGPTASTLRVAVGCAGGRHRAAAVGVELVALIAHLDPTLIHRDIDKPVINRAEHGGTR